MGLLPTSNEGQPWENLFNKWQVKDFVLRFIQLWSSLVVTHVSASLDQEPLGPLCSRLQGQPPCHPTSRIHSSPDTICERQMRRRRRRNRSLIVSEFLGLWDERVVSGSGWFFSAHPRRQVTWERVWNIQQEGKRLHSQWRCSARGWVSFENVFSIERSKFVADEKKKTSIVSQHFLADSHFCLWLWDLVLFLFEKKNNEKNQLLCKSSSYSFIFIACQLPFQEYEENLPF